MFSFQLVYSLVEQECSLALEPDAVRLLAISVCEDALTMHLSFLPLTGVLSAADPLEYTVPVSLVIQVVSFVRPAVWPCVLSFAIHVVVQPLADVLSSIKPLVRSLTAHLVVCPVA